MKKIKLFIRNFYRITVVRPTGAKAIKYSGDDDCAPDELIRSIIKNDPALEPDGGVYEFLAKRVAKKRDPIIENSLSGILLPIFSIKNIELKMAVISLIFVFSLGIKQPSRYQPDRKISPFSLADTLIDSARLENSIRLGY